MALRKDAAEGPLAAIIMRAACQRRTLLIRGDSDGRARRSPRRSDHRQRRRRGAMRRTCRADAGRGDDREGRRHRQGRSDDFPAHQGCERHLPRLGAGHAGSRLEHQAAHLAPRQLERKAARRRRRGLQRRFRGRVVRRRRADGARLCRGIDRCRARCGRRCEMGAEPAREDHRLWPSRGACRDGRGKGGHRAPLWPLGKPRLFPGMFERRTRRADDRAALSRGL